MNSIIKSNQHLHGIQTMTSTYQNNKILALTIGLCLLLIAFLVPTEVKAETDSVIVQRMDIVSLHTVELTTIPINELNTNQSMYGSNENEHIIRSAGSLWSDKYLGIDSSPWTDVLEEILSIFT